MTKNNPGGIARFSNPAPHGVAARSAARSLPSGERGTKMKIKTSLRSGILIALLLPAVQKVR